MAGRSTYANKSTVPASIFLFLTRCEGGNPPTVAVKDILQSPAIRADDIDQQMFVSVLSDFRAKYDALVAEYNESARAALSHNETTDVHVLLNKLDALVQSTRDAINVRLTSSGAAQLHSFVQSEKKNMKVTGD
jgi:hypothetical protein